MLLWSLYFLPAFLFKSLKTQGSATALPPGLSHKAIAVVPHGLLWLSAPTQQRAQGPQCGSQKLSESHWLSILLTGYFNLLWGWANNLSLPHFPDKLRGYTGVCSRLWKDEFFGDWCSASASWKRTPASVIGPYLANYALKWKSQ